MSRAQQSVKLIRNQQLRKLEHELKSFVNQFQSKVKKCEDIDAMDLIEADFKEGYSKFSEFGLAIEGKVTLNPDKNVISLQSEDMRHFDNVNILINELSISMKEKR
ncbi:GTPase IMAP family member 7-like isoform X2 [Biomphalaria pfeifferi]|uniref:GTPase IMAP family member 7-like isoform X2 n=1 Tax=Biomphalaria pfeifferi TaxID=112525 RepID=A0AAD8B2B1_BIOPF|nr:GTPase IMAP family member 7-like isoform X2 [Biomphalaria pfeifferi]